MDQPTLFQSSEETHLQMFQDTLTNNSIQNEPVEMMDYDSYHPILNNPSQHLNFSRAIIQNSDPMISGDVFYDSGYESDISNNYINLDESSSNSSLDSGYESNTYDDNESMDEQRISDDDEFSSRFHNVFDLYSAIRNYDSEYDSYIEREMEPAITFLNVSDVVQNLDINETFRILSIPDFLTEYPEENIQLLRAGIMDYVSNSDSLSNVYERAVAESLNEPVKKEPLPKEIFESLPVKTVDDIIMKELISCIICKQNYSLGEEIMLLPCADTHIFHTDCIERWFKEKSNCPLCWRLVKN